MKTASPVKGIMYVIRTPENPAAGAATHETDAWLPMWNKKGLMVCPVISSASHLNGNSQAPGRQR